MYNEVLSEYSTCIFSKRVNNNFFVKKLPNNCLLRQKIQGFKLEFLLLQRQKNSSFFMCQLLILEFLEMEKLFRQLGHKGAIYISY